MGLMFLLVELENLLRLLKLIQVEANWFVLDQMAELLQ